MSHDQIAVVFEREMRTHSFCLLSTVQSHLKQTVHERDVIQAAVALRRENRYLDLLCYVSYVENNLYHMRFDSAQNVEQLLIRRKNGGDISELFVEFLCLYVRSVYAFDEIVDVVLACTRQNYKADWETKVRRNLTLVPPNAVMADGRKYKQIFPQKFVGMEMDEEDEEEVMNKKVKDNKPHEMKVKKSKEDELPRLNESKVQGKRDAVSKPTTTKSSQQHNQPVSKHHNQPASKPQQPRPLLSKKLQLQSESQSEQYYRPGQNVDLFDLKQSKTKSSSMEVENHGNYMENKVEKMEIEVEVANKVGKNLKSNEQKESSDIEEDSMDMFMKEMKQADTKVVSKPSLGAKSLPAQKQTKLGEFCAKHAQPPKSQSVKQGNLFGFLNKKKQ